MTKPVLKKPEAEQAKWADKQIVSFTEWMNTTFSRAGAGTSSRNDSSPASSISSAGSDDTTSSMKSLVQEREERQIRERATLIFNSSEVCMPNFNVSANIKAGDISIRKDRNVLQDLGLQKGLMELLFSYELPFLKLGMEVLTKKDITLKKGATACVSGDKKWEKAVKDFIFENMLSNDDIKSKFTSQQLLHMSNQNELNHQLHMHFAQMFLNLVLLLDHSRREKLLHLSQLFRVESKIKSSKEMLFAFCREFLSGHGDFVKDLHEMDYTVSFEQNLTDEFDYSVRNLKQDLRDGVRLAKFVEILTNSNEISPHLRLPADSRLQKMHNVDLVLKELFGDKDEQGIEAKGIVDGNRETTLLLLWNIQYKFELRTLTDPQSVSHEVNTIASERIWRRKSYNEDDANSFAVSVLTRMSNGELQTPVSIHLPALGTEEEDPCAIENIELVQALAKWCNSIASQFGISVDNITSSLADGRVLCLLIHHYYPSILPVSSIRKTQQNMRSEHGDSEVIEVTNSDIQRALEGEHRNFINLKRACSTIGGIPLMLSTDYCSENPPDSKTMTIFLGYLFSRLFEDSKEISASIRIQRSFRKYLPKIAAKKGKTNNRHLKKNSAAFPMKIYADEYGVTDVGCTVVMSNHFAADVIKRLVRTYATRRWYLRTRTHLIEEKAHKEAEAERRAMFISQQLEREEIEAKEVIERHIMRQEEEESFICERIELEKVSMQRKTEEIALSEEMTKIAARREQEQEIMHYKQQLSQETRMQISEIEFQLQSQRMALEESTQHIVEQCEHDIAVKEDMWRMEAQRREELEQKLASMENTIEATLAANTRNNENKQVDLSEIEERMIEREQRMKESLKQEFFKLREEADAIANKSMQMQLRDTQNQKITQEKFEAEKLAEKLAEAEMCRVKSEQNALVLEKKQYEENQKLASFEKQMALEREARSAAEKAAAIGAENSKELQARIDAMEKEKVAMEMEKVEEAKLVQAKIDAERLSIAAAEEEKVKLSQMKKSAALHISSWWLQMKRNLSIKLARESVKKANAELAKIATIEDRKCAVQKDAANSICTFFNAYRPLRKAQILNDGFQRFAAFYRSIRVRRTNRKDVNEIYNRLRVLELSHKDKITIGMKTLDAVNTLEIAKTIPDVLHAVKTLEMTTQLSSECCKIFATTHSPTTLFSLIRSCNRSSPHQELLKIALSTLLNVSRHEKLSKLIASVPDSSCVLVDLMQTFRDKQSLFCMVCELLCTMISADEEVKNACNSSECRNRLDGIKTIIERKSKLSKRVRNISSNSENSNASITPKKMYLANSDPIVGIQHMMIILDKCK